jgi:hypothetical protein
VEKIVDASVEILWKTEQLILQFGVHPTLIILENQQVVSGTNV